MTLKELKEEVFKEPKFKKQYQQYCNLTEIMWCQFAKRRKSIGEKDAFCECLIDFEQEINIKKDKPTKIEALSFTYSLGGEEIINKINEIIRVINQLTPALPEEEECEVVEVVKIPEFYIDELNLTKTDGKKLKIKVIKP